MIEDAGTGIPVQEGERRMGRLIDADKFKERFCEENCGKRKCRDDFDKCTFIMALEQEPTAYDPDKVVKQLEERSKEYNSGVRLHGKPEEMLTDEAIEIVKGGGVNG